MFSRCLTMLPVAPTKAVVDEISVSADFAGNVKAAAPGASTGGVQKDDTLVAVKLKVSGDGVLLTCTPLA